MVSGNAKKLQSIKSMQTSSFIENSKDSFSFKLAF